MRLAFTCLLQNEIGKNEWFKNQRKKNQQKLAPISKLFLKSFPLTKNKKKHINSTQIPMISGVGLVFSQLWMKVDYEIKIISNDTHFLGTVET